MEKQRDNSWEDCIWRWPRRYLEPIEGRDCRKQDHRVRDTAASAPHYRLFQQHAVSSARGKAAGFSRGSHKLHSVPYSSDFSLLQGKDFHLPQFSALPCSALWRNAPWRWLAGRNRLCRLPRLGCLEMEAFERSSKQRRGCSLIHFVEGINLKIIFCGRIVASCSHAFSSLRKPSPHLPRGKERMSDNPGRIKDVSNSAAVLGHQIRHATLWESKLRKRRNGLQYSTQRRKSFSTFLKAA